MPEVVPPPLPLSYALQPTGTGRAARGVAWTVIVISVVGLSINNWRLSRTLATRSATVTTHVALPLELIGRYAIGVHALTNQVGTPDTTSGAFIAQLDGSAVTAADKLAVVPIIGELGGSQAALERLTLLRSSNPPVDKEDARILGILYASGTTHVAKEDQEHLTDHLGWFGKLALTFGQPPSAPQRAAVLSTATRTVATMAVGFGAIGVGLVAGLVLLIIGMVRLADRKLLPHYAPRSAVAPNDGGIFLQAFAIYLGGLTTIFVGAASFPILLHKSLSIEVGLMLVPTLLAIAWPRLRGVDRTAWRYGLGWHAGRGFLHEIGMGLVGYLAGLPIVAVGLIMTAMLVKLGNAHPSNPVEQMLGGNVRLILLAYFLAGIYAPLTEETLFRGAFFHALRNRHGWALSAVVTAFVFACIHPQGWSTIPALMCIAIVFAGLREWRGTILSSAAAHCLHNTALVTFTLFAMR